MRFIQQTHASDMFIFLSYKSRVKVSLHVHRNEGHEIHSCMEKKGRRGALFEPTVPVLNQSLVFDMTPS